MPKDIQQFIKKEKSRNYLAKDFDSFRADLLSYARTFFPDQIKDFSEASVGGLLLDMAAYVGDSLSFYLDHQFNELNPLTAIETSNLIRHIRNAGVDIVGASPATVKGIFTIEVPATFNSFGEYSPKNSAIPILHAGTIVVANNGTTFNLLEDLDFARKTKFGDFVAETTILEVSDTGFPTKYAMSRTGICVSGTEKMASFIISNTHVPFREIMLAETDITQVISIYDDEVRPYYQVESLTQDIVFGGVPTVNQEGAVVEQDMELIPAPRRFIKRMDPQSRLTALTFGGGNADTLDNDIIPDPSDLALPLYGKNVFSRFSIDPNSLLGTQTLGISPKNTTLTVRYRYGGGLDHNVGANTLNTISTLKLSFFNKPTPVDAATVKGTVVVTNKEAAGGGLPAPTLEELRATIPRARQAQGRLVTKSDTLARIYTLPSRFGRVFRAAISSNPNNPLASNLHIIGKDENGFLTTSPDFLKKNLSIYLNQYRLVSDAVDILDAAVYSFGVKFSVIVHPSMNKELVVQQVIKNLQSILTIDNFQINQPIVMTDIINMVINTPGVISMPILPEVVAKYGTEEDRDYGSVTFTPGHLLVKGMMVAPPGTIFQLKYPEFDIIGTAA